ncbi:unnamed protein product [Arctogadus glacialis]
MKLLEVLQSVVKGGAVARAGWDVEHSCRLGQNPWGDPWMEEESRGEKGWLRRFRGRPSITKSPDSPPGNETQRHSL